MERAEGKRSRTLQRDASRHAALAQLVEQLICNQQVVGSTPARGSKFDLAFCALYQGKRALSSGPVAFRHFASIGFILRHFSFSNGPNTAQTSVGKKGASSARPN